MINWRLICRICHWSWRCRRSRHTMYGAVTCSPATQPAVRAGRGRGPPSKVIGVRHGAHRPSHNPGTLIDQEGPTIPAETPVVPSASPRPIHQHREGAMSDTPILSPKDRTACRPAQPRRTHDLMIELNNAASVPFHRHTKETY